MELIGDLERAFATGLYPLRVPLGVLSVALASGLLWLAWRRGWLAAARRHPMRTAGLLVPALALALPLVWYLGSPLIIRTELHEEAPVVAAVDSTAAPSTNAAPGATPSATSSAVTSAQPSQRATPPVASATPTVAPDPTPLRLVGSFSGADDFHFGRGTALLIETEPGRYTLRFEDFSVRNGPDLHVYLSPDPGGYADGAVEVGRLRATDGSFNTPVPDGVDITSISSVVIWCKEFAVLFAVAPLET